MLKQFKQISQREDKKENCYDSVNYPSKVFLSEVIIKYRFTKI